MDVPFKRSGEEQVVLEAMEWIYFAFDLSQCFNHRNLQSQSNGLPLRGANIPVLNPAKARSGIVDMLLFSSRSIASAPRSLNRFAEMLTILLSVSVNLLSEVRSENVPSRMPVKSLFASDRPCKDNVPRKAFPGNVLSLL